MSLDTYLSERQLSFAAAARELGCTSQYLSRIVRGERQPSPALALNIERWSQGRVTRHELRPDVYPLEAA